MRKVGLLLAALVIGWVLLAMIAPTLLTSTDPLATDPTTVLAPPSSEHWFGTDQSGRDVYARVVHGARDSVLVGLRAVLIAMIIGGVLGTVAGLAPRWVDRSVSRIVTILLAFPEFLLALLVVAILGKGPLPVALGVTIAIIPAYARLARVTAHQHRTSPLLDAATTLGVPRVRAIVRHVLPPVTSALLGLAIIGFGSAIVTAAGLSFLGLGIAPPAPEWGVMMSEGKTNSPTGGGSPSSPVLCLLRQLLPSRHLPDHCSKPLPGEPLMTATPNHTPGIPTQAGATTPALTVENLTITSSDGSLVDDVSFTLHPGECVAFIGESGAGKSLTAKALIGLLPTPLQAHGTITLGDTVLSNPTPAPQRTWRTVRGARIGYIAQDALVSLDPLRTLREEVSEAAAIHTPADSPVASGPPLPPTPSPLLHSPPPPTTSRRTATNYPAE